MSKKKEPFQILVIKAYDHFTQPRIQFDDVGYDREEIVMTIFGELIGENEHYYILRTQFFTDEDKDIGTSTIHHVLKSTVISIVEYDVKLDTIAGADADS